MIKGPGPSPGIPRSADQPAADSSSGKPLCRGIVAGVFLVALLVRTAYLTDISESPTFRLPILDGWFYHWIGGEIAAGRGFTTALFGQSFLYPIFVSLFHRLFAEPILPLKIAQALLGAGSCALTAALGFILLGRREGFIAGMITAVYGPLIFYDGEILTAGLEAFLSVFFLLLVVLAARRGGAVTPAVAGVAGGALALTRTTFLPAIGAAMLWLLLRRARIDGRGRACCATLLPALLGTAVLLLPAATLCQRMTGRFTVLPVSGGINLYIGNSGDYCQSIMVRPGWQWNRLYRRPAEEGFPGFWGRDDYYKTLVSRFVRDRPLDFALGLAKKAVRFFSSRELPRSDNIYDYREWSWVLSATVWKAGPFGFPFGPIAAFAAVGFLLPKRRLPAVLPLFIVFSSLMVILVFPAGRYRAPLIAPLAVAASTGLVSLISALRECRRRKSVAIACVAGGVLLAVTLPGPFCEEGDYRSELDNLLGVSAAAAARPAEAIAWHRSALSRDPGLVDAWNNIGVVHLRAGQLWQAVAAFDEALRLMPDLAEAWNNRGYAFELMGNLPEAERSLRQAVEISPRYAVALTSLGRVLEAEGRYAEALDAYAAAPTDTEYAAPARRREDLLRRLGR